jgi:predicted transcriptional regulator
VIENTSKLATINGDELKKRRKALDMSQGKLAELLGVDLKTVNRYETGAREIPYLFELALRTVEREYKKRKK